MTQCKYTSPKTQKGAKTENIPNRDGKTTKTQLTARDRPNAYTNYTHHPTRQYYTYGYTRATQELKNPKTTENGAGP